MNRTAAPTGNPAKRILFSALTCVALIALLSLGTWQLQRLQWKQGLLGAIESRMASEAVPLEEIEHRLTQSGEVDYWPVRVSGIFEHENEQHFFATHKGNSGYFVYSPLRLADKRVLFVNRGFVPFDRKEPDSRPEGQLAGEVAITGLARDRLTEKPSWVVPENDLAKNIYYWKDLSAMARQSGYVPGETVVPFFVDADEASNPGSLPIGGVTLIDLPNNHLQYAITWYGLAAALAGVFGVWLWRQRVRPTEPDRA